MGRRGGRTGPGGAVVSSLSQNAGGAVNTPSGASNARRSGRGPRSDDAELLQLANISGKGKKGVSNGAGPANTAASSAGSSSSWLGKTPQQMLREWYKREEAKLALEPFVWGKSGLLTFVNAFDAWRELRRSGRGYASDQEFCTKHFLSRKALQSISDGRKQLADALADAGFGPSGTSSFRGWERDPKMNEFGKNLRVLRAVVCAALYPNVARIDLPNTVYREVAGGSVAKEFESRQLKIRAKTGERLFLHPESVNFLQGNYETRWLAYFSKVKTSKLYIRDTTMVSPYAILLFGGEIAVQHQKGQLSVDKWVVFKAPARVAVLARELRRDLMRYC